jgi:hypothetical protein
VNEAGVRRLLPDLQMKIHVIREPRAPPPAKLRQIRGKPPESPVVLVAQVEQAADGGARGDQPAETPGIRLHQQSGLACSALGSTIALSKSQQAGAI